MEQLRQWLLPGLLLGILLLTTLGPLSDREAIVPTPAPTDPVTTITYPDLPGRLIFRDGDQLRLLQSRQVRSIPLPGSFTLPEEAATAFAPNGRWVAGFVRQGGQPFLEAVDLDSGAVTRLGPAHLAAMQWSPLSDQVAVWDGGRLAIFGVRSGSSVFDLKGRITQVSWAPDGKHLAIELRPPDDETPLIELLDLDGEVRLTRITEAGSDPFWMPNGEGLVYVRYPAEGSLATELLLRKVNGQEVILATVEQLLQASPEVESIQGAVPHLTEVQGDYHPATILFALKYYSDVNPRFAIGAVSLPDSPVRLYLLPAYPDHPQNQNQRPPRPCYPGRLYPTEAGLFFVAQGFGCDGQLGRLSRGGLEPSTEPWVNAGTGLVAPDGSFVLRQTAPGTMPTAVSTGPGSGKLVPLYGDPIHWDNG